MNALILMTALVSGQCELGVCVVNVEATVVAAEPTLAKRPHVEARRIAPLRRTIHVIRDRRPLRTFVRSEPLRRLGKRLRLRCCR
jgi:hypothetical protein